MKLESQNWQRTSGRNSRDGSVAKRAPQSGQRQPHNAIVINADGTSNPIKGVQFRRVWCTLCQCKHGPFDRQRSISAHTAYSKELLRYIETGTRKLEGSRIGKRLGKTQSETAYINFGAIERFEVPEAALERGRERQQEAPDHWIRQRRSK